MSNHVFVSHSHQDAPAADLIVAELEKRGVPCWIAPRDVPAGGSYAESILTAIENASCFVLVYSEHSNVSSHVLREVERALKFELNIVPVRFDDSAPSKSLDYLLATVHWLSVGQANQSQSIARAAEQIAACVPNAGSTAPRAVPIRAPAPQPVTVAPAAARRSLPIAWIAVGLVIVASLIYWFVTKNATPVNASTLPVGVTRAYFSSLGKRHATAAYNLLSEDYRRRVNIQNFSRTVSTKPPVKLLDATEVSRTDRSATVAADFEDTDPAANHARWKGNIEFILESGVWRLASMKGLYAASGRLIRGPDEDGTQNISQATATPIPSSPSPSPGPR